MKTKLFLPLSVMLISLASCGDNQPVVQEIPEETYTLDTENSLLKWHGEENADHGHDGTLSFSAGSFTMKGDEVVSGEFTIDVGSIEPTTEGMPDEKRVYLKEHLMDTTILFFAEFPDVKVSTGAFNEGKLYTIISVRGVDITQEVPVSISQKEDELSIDGNFSVDLADAMIPYLTEPKESTGKPGAKSVIDFELKLRLNK